MDVSSFDSNKFCLNHEESNMKMLKTSMTLDLQSGSSRKKNLLGTGLTPAAGHNWTPSSSVLLESPDIKRCKLATPELERIIHNISTANNLTPTPSLAVPPAVVTTTSASASGGFSYNSRSEVTVEQAQYVQGFEDALEKLRSQENSDSSLPCSRPMSNSSASSCNTMPSLPPPASGTTCAAGTASAAAAAAAAVTRSSSVDPTSTARLFPSSMVPSLGSSPPMSPIDMKDQERIKLERKRLRNRIAASKCRRRKLEKISRLEEKVKTLKAENAELSSAVTKLRDHVCHLKQEVMAHVKQGCEIMHGNFHI